ncbi:MAG: DUF4292 domain-containing protein [Saprospiraceae bacterium]|nr:DUF4292 domain-containing protein [Saprospiraceae bacterium]
MARAKITPDSIFLINYFQREYVAEDLKFLEKKYNLPADFNLIQNLMLGNPIFLTDKSKLTLEKNTVSGAPILRGSDAKWSATYTLSATGEQLEEMFFEQVGTGRTLKILYKNYEILRGYDGDSRKMAFTRELYLESPQTGKASVVLDVNADGLEINIPKNIRFEIPDGYDKRN